MDFSERSFLWCVLIQLLVVTTVVTGGGLQYNYFEPKEDSNPVGLFWIVGDLGNWKPTATLSHNSDLFESFDLLVPPLYKQAHRYIAGACTMYDTTAGCILVIVIGDEGSSKKYV